MAKHLYGRKAPTRDRWDGWGKRITFLARRDREEPPPRRDRRGRRDRRDRRDRRGIL
jgi:hypothetical protein